MLDLFKRKSDNKKECPHGNSWETTCPDCQKRARAWLDNQLGDSSHRQKILALISDERQRQIEKWGRQNHSPERWLTILHEETGEAAKAILQTDQHGLISELVQAAAVIVARLESMVEVE